MSDRITRTAAAAGAWWALRLSEAHRDKRFDFQREVATRVEAGLREAPAYPVITECDYDPRGLLLDAVHAVGIECRGFLVSADGILPRKHELTVHVGRLEPKEGYGNWTDEIVVE